MSTCVPESEATPMSKSESTPESNPQWKSTPKQTLKSTGILYWVSLVLQIWIYVTCRVATWIWKLIQKVASCILADKDRAPCRLPSPRWLSVSEDGSLQGLERLPPLPKLPFDDNMSVAFAGCANLCMYMIGAAYALQQAPGSRSILWQFHGGSSGSFVAAPLAMGIDVSGLLLKCYRRFAYHRTRVGGCVGIYSESIGGITRELIEEAEDKMQKPIETLAGERLSISVTKFDPWPQHTDISNFEAKKDVIDTMLASCYIPVAYEQPIILPNIGFCVDGCAMSFLPNLQCVISPYHVHLADICPDQEYPETLVFNLMHGRDVLRLFEDGYLDCLKWLEKGAPSRSEERTRAFNQGGSSFLQALTSFKALIYQGIRVFLSISGIKTSSPKKEV